MAWWLLCQPPTNTKAIIDFAGYTAVELGPIAQIIHDKLLENVATILILPSVVDHAQEGPTVGVVVM